MKIKLFLLLVMFCIQKAYPQEAQNKVYFSIAFFGILGTHPGIKVGVQYPIATLNRENQDQKLNQFLATANVLLYFHRRNQLGLGLFSEVGFRNRSVHGLNKEVFLGLGYLRTFLPNEVYDFDQQPEGKQRIFLGNNHLLKTAAMGLGWNVKGALDAGFWSIRPTLLHFKPINTGSTLNFAIDAGYHF